MHCFKANPKATSQLADTTYEICSHDSEHRERPSARTSRLLQNFRTSYLGENEG